MRCFSTRTKEANQNVWSYLGLNTSKVAKNALDEMFVFGIVLSFSIVLIEFVFRGIRLLSLASTSTSIGLS